jgi:hypothetical protein
MFKRELPLMPRMKQVKAVLALSLAACTSWRVQSRPAPEVLEGKPRFMRLSLRSGQRIELHDAALQATAWLAHAPRSRSNAQRAAFAAVEVTKVEFLRTNYVATAFAVVGITIGVLAIVGAIAVSSGPEPTTSDCQPASPSAAQI